MLRILLLVVCATVLSAADGIALSLSFSLDGGKTWSSEQPMIAEAQPVHIRYRWRLNTPAEDHDMLYPGLARAGGDFPSANRGSPPWENGRRWVQTPVPSWMWPSRFPGAFR